jgi:hypothetical protein
VHPHYLNLAVLVPTFVDTPYQPVQSYPELRRIGSKKGSLRAEGDFRLRIFNLKAASVLDHPLAEQTSGQLLSQADIYFKCGYLCDRAYVSSLN